MRVPVRLAIGSYPTFTVISALSKVAPKALVCWILKGDQGSVSSCDCPEGAEIAAHYGRGFEASVSSVIQPLTRH